MLTPNHVVSLARIVAGILALAMIAALTGLIGLDQVACGLLGFVLGMAVLAALPRRRSNDIMLILAGGMIIVAMIGALTGLAPDLAKALAALGALGLLFLSLKLQRLRGMAARNGYMSFAEWAREDRRQSFNRKAQSDSARGRTRHG